jgi:hypothetical protein
LLDAQNGDVEVAEEAWEFSKTSAAASHRHSDFLREPALIGSDAAANGQ